MTDLAALTDQAIRDSGLDATDLRLRVRNAREDRLLPNSPRGKRRGELAVPTVEPVHAVVVLLAGMCAGPQTGTAATIRRLWALPVHGFTKDGKFYKAVGNNTLGTRLLNLMEKATSSTYRLNYNAAFTSLHVSHNQNRPYVAISHKDTEVEGDSLPTEHYMPPNHPMYSDFKAPISSISLCGPEAFLSLGEIIMQSRDVAAALGITLSSEDVIASLNSPTASLVGTNPENETAVTLPGVTAAFA